MLPGEAKALTSINKVEQGRWKLVSSASTIRNLCGGWMKMRVLPAPAIKRPPLTEATLSSARRLVVPTAMTRRPADFASLTASAVSVLTVKRSSCIS